MSNYNKESGDYRFSVQEWRKFRAAILSRFNAIQDRKMEQAQVLYEHLKNVKDPHEALRSLWRQPQATSWYSYRAPSALESAAGNDVITDRVLPDHGKLTRPTRAMFPHATRNTRALGDQDCAVGFNDNERVATWSTSDNNHSVDRARESSLAGIFFDLLSKTQWTRGTGGYIEYFSEHDDDNRPGPFTGQLKDAYGPIGKDEEYRRSQSISAYYGFSQKRRSPRKSGPKL